MKLREAQKELTRRKVLEAVLDLLADGSLDDLSVPAVAERSGVSLATIYRYFPTKSDLLSAAAEEPSRLALDANPLDSSDPDPLAAFQRSMWHSFASNLPLLRHQVSSTSGRDMRQARLDRSRTRLEDYVRTRGVEPSTPAGARLVSLLLLTSGSLALVELHDRQGIDLDEAIDASLWAAEVMIAASASSVPNSSTRQQPKKGLQR